jgi:hypothetical protein
MKIAFLLLVCALSSACITSRKSPGSVVRQADAALGGTVEVGRFEDRLNELGATIKQGETPMERIAVAPLPGKPGYFPPRTLRVVYVITDRGLIELKSAEVTSLGSRFAGR